MQAWRQAPRRARTGYRSLVRQALEVRKLLSGGPNLSFVDVFLSDAAGNPAGAPREHDRYWITARYATSDLPENAQYAVAAQLVDRTRMSPVDTSGAGQPHGEFRTVLGPFQLPLAGTYSATVTLDPTSLLNEVDESDNVYTLSIVAQPADPPPVRFQLPIGGEPGQDWSVLNYVDRDLGPSAIDWNGGNYTYNGHDGIDFMLANFAAMDRGLPVVAAADGVVVQTLDGQFDRQSGFGDYLANYVLVDHGQNWRTLYAHLRSDSVAVAVGQRVVAGQFLGYVGSSGYSTDAHLHFGVSHFDVPVETYLDPANFWTPDAILPYAGNTPGVLDQGVSDSPVTAALMKERPPDHPVFEPQAGQTVRYWARLHGISTTDTVTLQWYQPGGVAWGAPQTLASQDIRYGQWILGRNLPASPPPGQWQAALRINGLEQPRVNFTVSAQPAPEIRVDQAATYVLDGRTTPIEFGSAHQRAAAPTRTFTVTNHGTGDLLLGAMTVPTGFQLLAAPPAVVPRGQSGQFTLAMQTEMAGAQRGTIHLTTNDANEDDFSFDVAGQVEDVAARVVSVRLGSATDNVLAAWKITAAEQARPLPWSGLERLWVEFDEEIVIPLASARLRDSQGVIWPWDPGSYVFDPAAKSAAWKLATPLVAGIFQLEIDSGYFDAQSGASRLGLDGEWTNPQAWNLPLDAFPSGESTPGGQFVFRIAVLPGDANSDGTVATADYALWAAQLGLLGRWERANFDQLGGVGAADYALWAANFGRTLNPAPAGATDAATRRAAPPMAPSASASALVIEASRVEGSEAAGFVQRAVTPSASAAATIPPTSARGRSPPHRARGLAPDRPRPR